MSDTTSDDARQAAATEPSQTEPATQPANTPQPGADSEAKPAEPQAADPPKLDPKDRAIRDYAYNERMARREAQELREQLARLAPPRDPNAPPSQAELERMVEQRAQALNTQREDQARSQAWIAKGNAEYEDFTQRCNDLAAMGAGENAAFMTAVGRLPDGHKVIAELAAEPAEAARILKLPPVDLAIELTSMSHRIAAAPPPPPKPTSNAPPPIRPLATSARAEVNLSNLDGDAFRAAWNKRSRG